MQNDQKIIYSKALLNELINVFNNLSPDELKLVGEFLINKCSSFNKAYFEDEVFNFKQN